MRCRDVEQLCTSYVDGEVDDRVASALRGHLRTCSACRALAEDEAAIRDAAARLEPVDPPAELWSEIEARLAQAEIADAGRSRAWLWWQGLRQHALPVAVAVAAILVALVWNSRRKDRPEPASSARDEGVAENAAVQPAMGQGDELAVEYFLELREREVLEGDATYAAVIAELDAVVKVEREDWPAGKVESFDVRRAELEASARQPARELAVDRAHEPSSRDALYAAYRARIGHMQQAVLEELLR